MTQNMDGFFRVKLLNHLAVEVLIHLDDKTLTNCRSVCKAWKVLIDNQKFYYVRQLGKILHAEKYYKFLDIHTDWELILASFDTSKNLLELKNMAKFMAMFSKTLKLANNDPLQWIVSKNQLDWVKFLFPFVANLNKTSWINTNLGLIWGDHDNWTALMTASAEGFTEIAKYIFENSDGKDIGKILFMFLLKVLFYYFNFQTKPKLLLCLPS